MKYLIIGDAGSIFIKQYIESVLLPQNWKVILIKEGYVSPDYLRFYKENNVILEDLWSGSRSLFRHIPYLRSSLVVKSWCQYIKRKYGEISILHVHGLNRSRGNIELCLRSVAKKFIVSVWGDEIFRHEMPTLAKYEKYYDCADAITVATSIMKERFCEIYGAKYSHKIYINKFGIGLFDTLDSLTISRELICAQLGISNSNKIIVLVGHNGREAQRHIDITTALSHLPKQYFNKIVLVYTMTYGVKDHKYEDELKSLINELGCETVYLTQFMNEFDTACLRKVSDVLIHAQLTDAFSASIQECLYSGCIVLNGSWLKYTELPQYETRLVEYDNISDIPKFLANIIDNYKKYKDQASDNRRILREMSSIGVTALKWQETIDSVL